MVTTDPFKVEYEGPIAWLILNRPDKRNSMGMDFFRQFRPFAANWTGIRSRR